MANEEQLAILKQGVEVWNEWRSNHPEKVFPDFRGVDFGSINLDGANLRFANLINAQFVEANLDHANLDQAFLTGANLYDTSMNNARLGSADLTGALLSNCSLRGANLSMANLFFSKLIGVDLNGANLHIASFSYSRLENVDFTNSQFSGTLFAGIELIGIKGLEQVRHHGRSNISSDTLFRANPRLPDVFLRGCGVPEILIENLPRMLETANDYYSCFISYSSEDEKFAALLFDALRAKSINCWKASEQILPGERIAVEIDRGVTGWDKLLLCCSRSSLTQRWWVDFEVEKAFAKERQLESGRGQKVDVVIPLNLDGYLLSEEYRDARKSELLARLAADFTGWEHDNAIFEEQIERVIKALRTDGGKEPPPTSRL